VVTLENLTGSGERVYQRSPRLYHRAGHRFAGRIHEQLVPVGAPGSVRDTGIRLLHTGYALDPDALRAKCERNRRLLEQALADTPDDPYLWFQLGKGHFLTEAREDAERCFQKALSLMVFDGSSRPRDLAGAPLDDDTVTDLLTSLAYVCCRLGRPAEAVALLQEQEALGHPAALRPDTPHALGYALIQTGDLDGAWAAYARALGRDPATEQVRGTAGFASLFHLGLLCEAGDRHADAIKFYLLALLQESAHRPTLERCVGLTAEKGVLLPVPVLEAADQAALASVFACQVLEHEQRGNRATSSTLLCAAREMSEPLYQACLAALQERLRPE
jgi:tetratricopeptide (TPR) repeat protein